MFIDGLGLSEYRSFGRDVQRIGPFEKINFFIGQNNSGKSNILLFLKKHYGSALKCENLKYTEVDRHIGKSSGKRVIEFGIKFGGKDYNILLERFRDRVKNVSSINNILERIFRSQTLTHGTKLAWFPYEGTGRDALSKMLVEELYKENVVSNKEWNIVWTHLSGSSGGGITRHWIPETLKILSPVNLEPPKVDLIPAFREVKQGSGGENDFSGIGLIDRLMQLQNPSFEKPEERKKFNEINRFLRIVSGRSDATIQIPHNKEMILVEMDGKRLPLASLGTGIHEVIILAVAGTVLHDQVLCIEEPEIHMHPLLQKQLVRYLKDKTSNQYVISTHSAHILDTPDASVFHVTMENGESRVELALSDTAKSHICDDLGYRASDLLQANCVIWVEGPSDRIYLNHWVHSKAPELIEGLHYSIMFYGGRLLSHLTAEDPEIEEFISLRRLNRHISIVIDSDRSKESDDINLTKKRVCGEFNNTSGFAWVTEGRVIENYIRNELLEKAVKNVHKQVLKLKTSGKYDDPLKTPEVSSGNANFGIDKVKVAKEVVKGVAQLDVFDLEEKVEKVVKFVREANGLDTAS